MSEILSKFDPYAMVQPKTEDDYIALINEAMEELINLQEILDKIYK